MMKTKINIKKYIIPAFLGLEMLTACGGDGDAKKGEPQSTPTTGKITIGFDETLRPLLEEELNVFHATYPEAQVHAEFKPEAQVLKDFLDDKTKMILLSRKLTENEEKIIKARNFEPKTAKIANDAIAIILNRDNQDSVFRLEQLEYVFNGKFTDWKQLGGKQTMPIQIVFDNQGSSTLRYIQEKFNLNGPLPKNFSAVKSPEEVIKYVKANKNALGLIGVNWISNYHEEKANSFLQDIRAAAIFAPDTSDMANRAFKPYQANIALKRYPLVRELFLINAEGHIGLGTGFASFMAGTQGQTVINRAGLLPVTQPIRIMEVKMK